MVKCPRCGHDNISSTTYCENCSYILNGSPTGQKKGGWKMGTAKKIVLIIGIIAIALVLFSAINHFNQPTNEESLNVVVADNNVQQGSSHPYAVKVIYDGFWYSKAGEPSTLQEQSTQGRHTFDLDCAAWDKVYVLVEKNDDSTENMTVQLLKNGEVVAENSTTNAGGQITINYQS